MESGQIVESRHECSRRHDIDKDETWAWGQFHKRILPHNQNLIEIYFFIIQVLSR